MVEHGLAAFPNEACGLLAGKEGRPVKFFAMRNQDASPVSYRLDPKEQLQCSTEMEDEGWQTCSGSSTRTRTRRRIPPRPIRTGVLAPDRVGAAMAMFPDAYYLMMSLADRTNPVLRAFRIVEAAEVDEDEVAIG